jgi:hypothetical protein
MQDVARKTLLISLHNVERKYWNGICYDFTGAIGRIENAVTVAPPGQSYFSRRQLPVLVRENGGSIRAALRDLRFARQGALVEVSRVEEDFDLCFFMLFFLDQLHQIERVKGWRERSGLAAVFFVEAWSGALEAHREQLRLLDKFDHVFVLNEDVIPALAQYTRTPISYLATATDCLRASPEPVHGVMPERGIDILSLGRQLPDVHERLIEIAARRGLFYHHDIWTGMRAVDWEGARAMNAELTRRARYSVVWDPTLRPLPGKMEQIAGDRVMTTRFFEATAGGAIMIGQGTPAPAFAAAFDWADAIVPIAPDGSDVEAVIDALDADPDRQAAIRTANVTNALRRHDWVYRWQHILDTFGLEPTPAHRQRRAMLAARAERVAAASWRERGSRRRASQPE